MNKLYCVGNLTSDAKLVKFGERDAAQFTIGVRTSTKDKQTNNYVSNFVSVIVFSGQAISCANLKKGAKVAISGDLCAAGYMTRDGRPGVNLNVKADSVDFLSPNHTGAPAQPTPQPDVDFGDSLPF